GPNVPLDWPWTVPGFGGEQLHFDPIGKRFGRVCGLYGPKTLHGPWQDIGLGGQYPFHLCDPLRPALWELYRPWAVWFFQPVPGSRPCGARGPAFHARLLPLGPEVQPARSTDQGPDRTGPRLGQIPVDGI